MAGARRASFEDFVLARGQALQRFGYLLTSDWALAEDLVRTAFARAYPRWPRLESGDPEAHVRKIMIDTWSSRWRRHSHAGPRAGKSPEVAAADPRSEAGRRQAITCALAALPPRQRLVLVLCYHEDLTEQQVAELLGISAAAAKSQAAKALAGLRAGGALDIYRAPLRPGA